MRHTDAEDGRPDRHTDGSLLHYPGLQWTRQTLHSTHTHTHWIVGRQKRRALDSFERIKEAEKLVEMHWVDLQNCKELNKRCEHTDSVASGFIAVEGFFFL